MVKIMTKGTIAIDIDEVLAPHNATLAEFHNKNFGTNHSVEDYSDDWHRIWGVDSEEGERRAQAWLNSKEMENMQPLPDAEEVLRELKADYRLLVVTGRRFQLVDSTERWVNKHYPGLFEGVTFVGLWEFRGSVHDKAATCLELGVDYIVDDSTKQAIACANAGLKSILFGDYSWNRDAVLPARVTRVNDWSGVRAYFNNLRDRNV